jgi:translation initiation factor eIF-2B subunit beta
LAAKAHAIPVVVCTGLYKLSPLFPHDIDLFNVFAAPCTVLKDVEFYEEDERNRIF